MPGDYTRMRYSPRSGYIGVLEQQGRVRLDADGNELVESIDRRRRAECIDTIGFAVFPTDPVNGLPTTNGFQINGSPGSITIGAGRGYVDGIQVDCWGSDPQQFQPNLGESVGQTPLPYDSQPFFYSPGFPEVQTAGNSIVYLDVWEREVTALEDPNLMDPALEGIDTTTRLQAAWQVKAKATTASACSDTPAEWTSLIAPSTGVLSSGTQPAPSGASPCTIDPVGGYTGLENRLYRVQIWKSGSVGGTGSPVAQFVWSQDNASLGAAITGVNTVAGVCKVSVTTVGRDQTLRFQVGDNLEVLSDFTEWSIRENDQGGQFVTVTAVDPEQLTVFVSADISAWFTALPPGVHPRLRKWDAAPQPTNNGTAIPLGTEGVTVTFGADPAATLKAGDYWLFCARTATGDIEHLTNAPPRGLHHYAKLAVVNPLATPPVQDCRTLWPPTFGSEACCTIVVNVGDDIQKAIDSLPSTGGCVCLKAGVHILGATLSISNKKNIMFHGESIGAVVQGPLQRGILIISNSSDITVENISFTSAFAVGPTRLVELEEVKRCAFRSCVVSGNASPFALPAGFGVYIGGKLNEVEISNCVITGVFQGILASEGANFYFARNQITGMSLVELTGSAVGIEIQGLLGPAKIIGNAIVGFAWGIMLSGSQLPGFNCVITDNMIQRGPLFSQLQPLLNFTGALGKIVVTKTYGIVSGVSGVVADNLIQSADPSYGGILGVAPHLSLERNRIESAITPQDNTWSSLPIGIVVYQPEGASVDHVRVVGNTLLGPQNGITAVAETTDLVHFTEFIDNRMDPGRSLVQQMDMTQLFSISTIENALAQLNTSSDSPPAPFGILLLNTTSANVVRNTVSQFTVGIAVESTTDWAPADAWTALDGNEVDNCAVGILLFSLKQSSVLNGRLQNNIYSMALDTIWNSLAEGNLCSGSATLVHCYEITGLAVQISKNRILNGATGILSYQSDNITIADNDIEFTNATGILVFSSSTEATVVRNRLSGCGATAQSAVEANAVGAAPTPGSIVQWNFGTSVSAAIALVECAGLQTVEGCHLLSTGQVSNGQCADVLILNGAHARVRDCRVDRQTDAGVAAVDSGIYVYPTLDWTDSTFSGADVSGNYLNMRAPLFTSLLAVDVECIQIGSPSDSLFNGNTILQQGGGSFAVKLVADSLAVTGNRIRLTQERAFSLIIQYQSALSYVGNVVSFGQLINGFQSNSVGFFVPQEWPSPPQSFNVNR